MISFKKHSQFLVSDAGGVSNVLQGDLVGRDLRAERVQVYVAQRIDELIGSSIGVVPCLTCMCVDEHDNQHTRQLVGECHVIATTHQRTETAVRVA